MIDFGNQAVGTMSTQQMTITNTSNEALGITEVTVSGDYSATDNCVAASPLSPAGLVRLVSLSDLPRRASGLAASTLRLISM